MSYAVRLFADVASFDAETSAFLRADEDKNNLILSLIKIMSGTNSETGTPLYLGVYKQDQVVGVAIRTGSNRALIGTDMPRGAAHAVWRNVANEPEVTAELNGETSFVDEMINASGLSFEVFMYLGSFRLTEVSELKPVAGRLRLANASDIDILEDWNEDFALEAVRQEDPEARAKVERLIERGALYVWEVDGRIVSQTYNTQPMGSSIKITGVYTPKELRGKGYAYSLVGAVTKKLLADGFKKIFLFTDLANPTSNSIYKKIGYKQFSSLKHVKRSK